ncbi:MAG: hypothetical protein LLF28_02500 [Nitrospiraceae bacterium]|nr:hypothetical protein [Nitrospiraceae bacterium]
MKKIILIFLFFWCFLLVKDAGAYDIKGIQPISPYGIFSTFTTDSPQKGKSAAGISIEKSADVSYYNYLLQYSYGIKDNIEITSTLPYVHDYQGESGYEDFALGIKHRFSDEGKYDPSLAYMINVSLNSGRQEFSTDGRIGGGFIMSKKVGPVSGHLNAFYEKAASGNLKDELIFSAGFDFSAAHNFKVIGEIYSKATNDFHKFDQIEGRLGYRFIIAENIFTTIGIGTDFKDRNPEYRLLFSLAITFPKEKRPIKTIYEEEK